MAVPATGGAPPPPGGGAKAAAGVLGGGWGGFGAGLLKDRFSSVTDRISAGFNLDALQNPDDDEEEAGN